MKRFHSSGTASGNIEVMLRWKRIIPTIAIVRTVSLSTVISRNGQMNSWTVPKWAIGRRQPRRPHVLGVVPPEPALERASSGSSGALLIIVETTNGKWWLSFEDAAPHQMKRKMNCQATIHWSTGKSPTTSIGA